jgi:hypothetical protein
MDGVDVTEPQPDGAGGVAGASENDGDVARHHVGGADGGLRRVQIEGRVGRRGAQAHGQHAVGRVARVAQQHRALEGHHILRAGGDERSPEGEGVAGRGFAA